MAGLVVRTGHPRRDMARRFQNSNHLVGSSLCLSCAAPLGVDGAYGLGAARRGGSSHFGELMMTKRERIVRYSDDELRATIARGESRTDRERSAAMTDEELEASIAADPDEAGMEVDWSNVMAGIPGPKAVLHMRVDRDVLDFFRGQGKGYQTTINAVLRSYVEQKRTRTKK
jgi:uncharacterized protein (DUF4415 family)